MNTPSARLLPPAVTSSTFRSASLGKRAPRWLQTTDKQRRNLKPDCGQSSWVRQTEAELHRQFRNLPLQIRLLIIF